VFTFFSRKNGISQHSLLRITIIMEWEAMFGVHQIFQCIRS
jgi:hypothetical protein